MDATRLKLILSKGAVQIPQRNYILRSLQIKISCTTNKLPLPAPTKLESKKVYCSGNNRPSVADSKERFYKDLNP